MQTIMPNLLKSGPLLFLSFISFAALARSQAIPAASAPGVSAGFELPTVAGSLHYGLTASETIEYGYEGQNATSYATNLSGNLGYISGSESHPFSALFSGGYFLGTTNQPSSYYDNLALSQVFSFGRWSGIVADRIDYLPEAAVVGLSGVPGVGDANLPPGQLGPDTTQNVLSNYSTRIDNLASASISRHLTGATSLSTTGSMSIARFTGSSPDAGLESNGYTLSESLQHRIDARTGIGVSYNYSNYSFLGQNLSNTSQSVSVQFQRQLTRKIGVSLSAGPERITSNSPLIPTSDTYVANATLSYLAKASSISLGYARSTNSGSGVVAGANTDDVNLSYARLLGRSWHASANFGYVRTQSLAVADNSFDSNAVIGAVQVNRSLGRDFSLYASYTAERQNSSGNAVDSPLVFSGFTQIIGAGLTYSPRSIRVGHP